MPFMPLVLLVLSCCCFLVSSETYSVTHDGFSYRTLEPGLLEGQSKSNSIEQVWMSIPAGYDVAPDSDTIATEVVAAHYWDIWRLCTVGKCYGGKHYLEYDNFCGTGVMCVKDTVKMWEKNSEGQFRIKESASDWYRLLIRKACDGSSNCVDNTAGKSGDSGPESDGPSQESFEECADSKCGSDNCVTALIPFCASFGDDCCAPGSEHAKCYDGYVAIRTGKECHGDNDGMYTCCGNGTPAYLWSLKRCAFVCGFTLTFSWVWLWGALNEDGKMDASKPKNYEMIRNSKLCKIGGTLPIPIIIVILLSQPQIYQEGIGWYFANGDFWGGISGCIVWNFVLPRSMKNKSKRRTASATSTGGRPDLPELGDP